MLGGPPCFACHDLLRSNPHGMHGKVFEFKVTAVIQFPLCSTERAMQAPRPKRPIICKQVKLQCPKDDIATIPIFFNKWISTPDTTWFTPALIFHKKVLGDGLVDEASFLELLHSCTSRMTTESEIKLLQRFAFVATNSSKVLMVKVEELAITIQKMNLLGVDALVTCLKDMPPIDGTTNPTNHTFPHNIPQCAIGEEQLKGDYSLCAIAPHFCEEGTKWAKQLAALEKAKNGKCLVPCLPCLPPLLAFPPFACLHPLQHPPSFSPLLQTHQSPAMAR